MIVLQDTQIGFTRIRIAEARLPDAKVVEFLDTLDDQAKETYRHAPNVLKELQWYAFLIGSESAADKCGKIVAYGSLECVKDNEVVFGCVVHQDFRGKGLGRLMYKWASKIAEKYDRSAIIAEQDHDNIAARTICEAEGYTFSELIDDPASRSGKIVRLRKQIKFPLPEGVQ